MSDNKKFRTILADPPWYQRGGGKVKRGADRHYDLLKEKQILATMRGVLDDRVEENAHLYLWVANNHLPEALRIIEALGFRYITNIVWTKTSAGLGQYFRGKHELCLFAVKGRGFDVKTQTRSITTQLGDKPIPTTRHSAKPFQMYDLIEARSKGPYLEMFARHSRPGWDVWGLEVDDTI